MRSKIDDLGKASVTVEKEDHNSAKPYYENTIVVDSNLGICCISLRPVPAGIPITDTRFWKCLTKLDSSIMLNYRKLLKKVDELEQILNSLIKNKEIGVPFSNNYGDSEIIGMTQKAISDNFCAIRKRLSDLEGTNEFDFSLSVVPTYIETEDSIEVNVICDIEDLSFDSLKIYFNDELKIQRENVTRFEYTDSIDATTVIKVEGIINGNYSMQYEIVKVNNIENNTNN